MAFRIVGNDIEIDGFPFARILPNVLPTKRDYAEESLYAANPKQIEAEREEAIKEVENDLNDTITDLEQKVRELESTSKNLNEELDRIERAEGVPGRINELTLEIEAWRSRCKTYEDLYRSVQTKLQSQKPRRPTQKSTATFKENPNV